MSRQFNHHQRSYSSLGMSWIPPRRFNPNPLETSSTLNIKRQSTHEDAALALTGLTRAASCGLSSSANLFLRDPYCPSPQPTPTNSTLCSSTRYSTQQSTHEDAALALTGLTRAASNSTLGRSNRLKSDFKKIPTKSRKSFKKALRSKKRYVPRGMKRMEQNALLDNIKKGSDSSRSTLYVLNKYEVDLLWDCSIVLHTGCYNKSTMISWEIAHRGKDFNPKGTFAFLAQVKDIGALGKEHEIFYYGNLHAKTPDSYDQCDELGSDSCPIFNDNKIDELLEVKKNFLNKSHQHYGSRGDHPIVLGVVFSRHRGAARFGSRNDTMELLASPARSHDCTEYSTNIANVGDSTFRVVPPNSHTLKPEAAAPHPHSLQTPLHRLQILLSTACFLESNPFYLFRPWIRCQWILFVLSSLFQPNLTAGTLFFDLLLRSPTFDLLLQSPFLT